MFLHKRILSTLSGTVFLFSLSTLLPISANDFPLNSQIDSAARSGIFQGYVPPTNFRRISRAQGAGSRGCSQGKSVDLTLIIPNDHTATTVLGHPTFLWYVSDPAPINFAIVEPGVAKPILEKELKVEKAGIVRLDLPQKISQLEPGKEYRWTVSIICNAKRHSENIYVQAFIKRVEATPTLQQQLKSTTNERDRASIYAKNGVWYDAIATIQKASQTTPRDRLAVEYFQQLLKEIGFSKVTTAE